MRPIMLRDRHAALTIATALLGDRIADLSSSADPKMLDDLKYVFETLAEMTEEVADQIQNVKKEVKIEIA
jgi:hypothetical protein